MIDRGVPYIVLRADKARPWPGSSAHYHAAEFPRQSFVRPVARRIFGDHIEDGRVPFPPTYKMTPLYREDFLVIVHFRQAAFVRYEEIVSKVTYV